MKRLRIILAVLAALAASKQAGATITAVQEVVNPTTLAGTSTTTQTVTITGVHSGAILAAFAETWMNDATVTTATMADNQNGSWTVVDTIDSNAARCFTGYFANSASGSVTLTVTYSRSVQWTGISIFEITGGATASPLAGHASQKVSFTTATDNATSGNMTLSSGAGLIVGWLMNENTSATVTAGTGFSSFGTFWSSGNQTLRGEYQRKASPGTYAATWTLGSSQTACAQALIFKEASAGTTTPDGQGFFGQPGLAAGDSHVYQLHGDRLVPVPRLVSLEGTR